MPTVSSLAVNDYFKHKWTKLCHQKTEWIQKLKKKKSSNTFPTKDTL